jgi:hypothetical protein
MFEPWLSQDAMRYYPRIFGHTKYQVQNCLGQGFVNCWVDNSITIKNGRVKNQSFDHYTTVPQLAGILIDYNFENVITHLWDDVDISGIFNWQSYAFEYERPKSNSRNRIDNKTKRYQPSYDNLIFVCSTANEKLVRRYAGDNLVLRRGNQLRRWLDSLNNG